MQQETKVLTNEALYKEIDLIQSCITRMVNNSFMLKGWLITLIIALIALLPNNINRHYLCGTILLMDLAFWYLDAFFTKLERLYRWKYEWVIVKRLEGNHEFLYNLNPYEKNMWGDKKEPCIVEVMLKSTPLLIIYGGIFLLDILLIIFKFH